MEQELLGDIFRNILGLQGCYSQNEKPHGMDSKNHVVF